MYHYVSEPPPGADAIRRDLSVPPERFRKHLQYLSDAGYTTITLRDLVLALQTGYHLPEKPVLLTFDDGYRDAYACAFPILKEFDFVGTFFLVTGFIDEGRPEHVSWDQVIEMNAAGMDMEAHGHTHTDLRDRSVEYLVWQVLGAKEAIEARTRKPVHFFCYPSGKYDEQVIRVLKSAHYWAAVTVDPGVEHRSDRLFELRRIRVHGEDGPEDLARVLQAYMTAAVGGQCVL